MLFGANGASFFAKVEYVDVLLLFSLELVRQQLGDSFELWLAALNQDLSSRDMVELSGKKEFEDKSTDIFC